MVKVTLENMRFFTATPMSACHFFLSVYSGGSGYASGHELYGHAAAAHNSIADQCEVFFLMRTRLGITIVGGGGGRGRACVCDGSTLYTKIYVSATGNSSLTLRNNFAPFNES